MPTVTITNMSTELYYELKTTAEQHHRTVSNEVIVCLEERLFPKKIKPEERLADIQALRAKIKSNFVTSQMIEQAVAEGRP